MFSKEKLTNIKDTFNNLGKFKKKERKKILFNFPNKAYTDIKAICKNVCHNKKCKPRTLKKIKRYKSIFRKFSKSSPKYIKNTLIKQKGKGIFTALAAGVIPLIANLIGNAIKG